ncbi:MAG: hypothetical protein GY811_18720 [Myxococcales bacterium]|nr:hypothetical protein [Myxococcales bacterium]
MEILFKILKSVSRMDKLRSANQDVIDAFLYASLLGLVLAQGICAEMRRERPNIEPSLYRVTALVLGYHAKTARELVEGLQTLFVGKLEVLADELGQSQAFERVDWVRDGGAHGGGNRYVQVKTGLSSRAAVNVSGVHYDDGPEKKLSSADALSTIIHPQHPLAPSVYMHFSWTEMRLSPRGDEPITRHRRGSPRTRSPSARPLPSASGRPRHAGEGLNRPTNGRQPPLAQQGEGR